MQVIKVKILNFADVFELYSIAKQVVRQLFIRIFL